MALLHGLIKGYYASSCIMKTSRVSGSVSLCVRRRQYNRLEDLMPIKWLQVARRGVDRYAVTFRYPSWIQFTTAKLLLKSLINDEVEPLLLEQSIKGIIGIFLKWHAHSLRGSVISTITNIFRLSVMDYSPQVF